MGLMIIPVAGQNARGLRSRWDRHKGVAEPLPVNSNKQDGQEWSGNFVFLTWGELGPHGGGFHLDDRANGELAPTV